jgi:hypothetical protein
MFTGVLFFIFVASGAGMFISARASAQVTFTNDEAQFFADNPGLLVQTFNSAITSGCEAPFDSTNSAGCFPPGAILPGVVYDVAPSHEFLDIFAVNFNGTSGNASKAIGPDNHTDTLDIIFKKGGVSAAGVRPGCFVLTGEVCRRTVTISVYGAGDALLGSTQADVSSRFDDFVGIESDIPIAKISVAGPDLGPDSGFHAIDELVFSQGSLSPIPTLSEWGMIAAAAGLIFVGVFFAARKRLRTSNGSEQATIASK